APVTRGARRGTARPERGPISWTGSASAEALTGYNPSGRNGPPFALNCRDSLSPSGPRSSITNPRIQRRGARPERPRRERSRMMESTPHTALETEPRMGEALSVNRLFTQPGVHPFDQVEWEVRDARIG